MDRKTQIVEKIFDILGEIMAVLTIVLYAVLIINANWTFIPEGTFLTVLKRIREYAALIVVAIVGFEAMVKGGFITKLLYLIFVGLIVLVMFFPGTWDNIAQIF